MNHKCDCGEKAVYIYLPSSDMVNPFFCKNCVSRGCSCNYNYLPQKSPDGKEGIDFQWIDDKTWEYLDNGKQYPCCEYFFDEEGFDEK